MISVERRDGRMKRRLAAVGAAVTVLLLAGGAQADTGHLVIGARPQGMGSAYVAVADDANAAYWNPAGLVDLKSREFTYTYWRLSDVSGVGVNFAALAMPLSTGRWRSALGLSVARVGAELEEGPAATQSDMADSRYSLSLGLELTPQVSVGATLNRLQVNSDVESGSGFGFEVGVRAKPLEKHKLYLGATGRNLSADIKNEDLEEAWRMGAAWTTWKDRLTFAGDLNVREDINGNEGKAALWYGGIEVSPIPEFQLRGGGGSHQQWGIGFGVNQRNIYLDYALSGDDDVLGTSHRFTLSYRFGEGS